MVWGLRQFPNGMGGFETAEVDPEPMSMSKVSTSPPKASEWEYDFIGGSLADEPE